MARENGISKITLFELKTDDVGGTPTYEAEGIRVPWAVNFETEDEYYESEYKADNTVESAKSEIQKVTATMEVSSDTPPSLDAKITGKGYKNGMAFKRRGQKKKAYALAYEISMDDGNLRRRVIYNMGFTRKSQTNATEEDGSEQTYNYEGVGFPLNSTGDVEATMDLAEINALEDSAVKTKLLQKWNNFFTKPQFPDDEE